jgi:ABC-2 type transport system ATP-binding protein
MELIAGHVVIIGDGEIIADLPLEELRQESAARIRVQGPDLRPLLHHLRKEGAAVEADETGTCAAIIAREPREIFDSASVSASSSPNSPRRNAASKTSS